jgi:beta-glucosidase
VAIFAHDEARGGFHWSLLDSFEWAEGFDARFGLYSFDARTLARRARPSTRLYSRIATANALP